VVRHKATSPQQMDGSVVFAMCANVPSHEGTLAHVSPQLKCQIDRFSHFCTAHGRLSSGMPGYDLSLIIAPPHRGTGPHALLATLKSITKTASRSVQLFLYSSRQNVVVLLMLKSAPSHGDLGPHLIRGSLGPSDSIYPNGILIGPAVFAHLTA